MSKIQIKLGGSLLIVREMMTTMMMVQFPLKTVSNRFNDGSNFKLVQHKQDNKEEILQKNINLTHKLTT